MKKRKWLIPLIVVIFISIIGFIIYQVLGNKYKLTSEERTWINENINNIQNIYVVKDENVFSKDGHGVFYDLLKDFEEQYDINVNLVNFDNTNEVSGIILNNTESLNDNSEILYTDHYVLLSKNNEIISNISYLDGANIGLLSKDTDYIKSYFKDINVNFSSFETIDDLINSFDNGMNYIILPRIKYIDKILMANLTISYHLSDINTYYTFTGNNDILSRILSKFLAKWDLDKSLKNEEFTVFKNALGLSDTDVDKLLSVNYNYGFINNSPYEVIMSGNYGGIISEYLQEFSKFSGVYFKITKYRNNSKLLNAINKGKVDIYFDFNSNISTNYLETTNGINTSLSILTNKNNTKSFNSVYGLQGEKVYVEENSNILDYLNTIGGIEIHTYSSLKELFKLNKEDKIIVMDSYIYNYYSKNKLDNYISKYDTSINSIYSFRIKQEYEILHRILNKYINFLDTSNMINRGLNSHSETIMSGSILNTIAKYFILGILIVLIVGLIVYKNSKKIRIAKRLKKDEKIRFIDELTCLKNRAYLSDFIKSWSNNSIYPQAVIVVDLNKLQEINDHFGVLEGDKQIQAFANALIKTQLDNSDLMRSDGNEFVIYTVGYNQKQIINYIHKLSKELKKLPYNYGAEFGYSMILNNLKTIEDALNEATEDMKNKKMSVNK